MCVRGRLNFENVRFAKSPPYEMSVFTKCPLRNVRFFMSVFKMSAFTKYPFLKCLFSKFPPFEVSGNHPSSKWESENKVKAQQKNVARSTAFPDL
jgi:hypothetical protein